MRFMFKEWFSPSQEQENAFDMVESDIGLELVVGENYGSPIKKLLTLPSQELTSLNRSQLFRTPIFEPDE